MIEEFIQIFSFIDETNSYAVILIILPMVTMFWLIRAYSSSLVARSKGDTAMADLAVGQTKRVSVLHDELIVSKVTILKLETNIRVLEERFDKLTKEFNEISNSKITLEKEILEMKTKVDVLDKDLRAERWKADSYASENEELKKRIIVLEDRIENLLVEINDKKGTE
jgi:peptidoglycan hydrolase CwlO-like protein